MPIIKNELLKAGDISSNRVINNIVGTDAVRAINAMAATYGISPITVDTIKGEKASGSLAKALYDKIAEANVNAQCSTPVDLNQISNYKVGDIITASLINTMEIHANQINAGHCACYCNHCSCDCARCSCNCRRCSCNCDRCSCQCSNATYA